MEVLYFGGEGGVMGQASFENVTVQLKNGNLESKWIY